MKTREIGELYGVHRCTIGNWLRYYGIPIRDEHFKKEMEIEPELLWALYWGNELSTKEISNEIRCSQPQIMKLMKKYKIPTRPLTDSNKISINSGKFIRGQEPWNKYLPSEMQSNWQGGKSFEPYGLEFNKKLKKRIRKRDNFTCQECGMIQKQLGYKLHVHHIDYNKKNNSEDNLISLCASCHLQTNFNRNDWTKYYLDKLDSKLC